MRELKPLYCIWNDGDFADDFVGCNPCQVACNITSRQEAEDILKHLMLRFSDYDAEGFYIVEDYDTVADRIADGETLTEIFNNDTNAIFY